ncbi:hypothetical protein [Streptomyces sp. V2I9]|uniref:hypothetical protein n=1 Tax=Streptomyces sp. V2I9 TaxID=3042304 RepID=UPI0035932675
MATYGAGFTLDRYAQDTAVRQTRGQGVGGTWFPAAPDGTKQLTIDCRPLPWFTGDEKPGDTNGQGVNGTWFAVRPDGKLPRWPQARPAPHPARRPGQGRWSPTGPQKRSRAGFGLLRNRPRSTTVSSRDDRI